MARGYSDYVSSSDKFEVISRPTSIIGTGKILHYDDFSEPYTTWLGGGASDHYLYIVTNVGFTGGNCMKIGAGTGAGYSGTASLTIGLPITDKVGFECKFATNSTKILYTYFYIWTYYESKEYIFGLRWDYTNKKWQYYDSSGAWTDVTGGSQNLYYLWNTYHYIKFVVDIKKQEYVWFVCNNLRIDMSGIGGYYNGVISTDAVAFQVRIESSNNTQPYLLVDEIAIMQEE